MTLKIFTLGSFRVLREDVPLAYAVWKTQKNKTLLQLLLTFRHHPLVRDQFLEYLWPNLDPVSADRNLRVAISQLRRALNPNAPSRHAPSLYILTGARGYAWNLDADYWLDADEFENLCAQSEHAGSDLAAQERARQMYRGDYLAEERYADWAIAERERLREMYFALLTRMAETYARRGQYRRAIALTREILAADRVRESVWCQLMLYHYHAGDSALALRAFNECATALAQELDAEPMPETIALAEQIRTQRVSKNAYPPAHMPEHAAPKHETEFPPALVTFVGREREWVTLMQCWNSARANQGGALLIQGEAGVGKTRLAHEFTNQAHANGAHILEGKGRELGGALPYQPLIDALRASPEAKHAAFSLDPLWRIELARLVPEWNPTLADAAPSGDVSRLYEAVTRLFLEMARAAPLVIFLDDAQWFDDATIHCFAYSSQRLHVQPIWILLTARFDEVEPADALTRWLNELERARLLRHLKLSPLSPHATNELVNQASHASPRASELAAYLYRETQGVPLYLLALLQAHFEDGLLYTDERGQWHGAENLLTYTAVPERIQTILSGRVRRLDARVQNLLQLAAVLGYPFDLEWLQTALNDSSITVLDDLDQALERNFLRATESPRGILYDLSHDLLRRVIYNALAPERRARAHRQTFRALEKSYGQDREHSAELAHHARAARLWRQAIAYSIRAAEYALESYAISEAARHCEQGLAALDALRQSGEHVEMHERLVWQYDLLAAKQLSAHLLGTREIAPLNDLLALARELKDSERLAKAYYALMRYHIDTGQNDAALALVPLYEPLVAQGVSSPAAIGFYQRVGFLYYRTGDFERALHFHDQALRLARDADDAHWQAYVLNTRGTVLMCLGRYQDALADFTRAAELWKISARQIFRTFALDNRADVFYYLGQYERALATKRDALAQYREFGYPIAEAECLSEIGFALRETGKTSEAENFLHQALALSEKLGDRFDLAQSLNGLAALYLGAGEPAQWQAAVEYAARAVKEGESANLPHTVIQGLAYGAFASLHLEKGADALELGTRAIELLEQRKYIEGAEEEIYFIYSRVLAANGRAEDAQTALARAYAEMIKKADALDDPELHSSFLERVRLNRAIRDAHAASS